MSILELPARLRRLLICISVALVAADGARGGDGRLHGGTRLLRAAHRTHLVYHHGSDADLADGPLPAHPQDP